MEEIIVQKMDDKTLIIVLERGKIVEYYEYQPDNMPTIGNIYVGQIKDVLPKSNTLFVDYGNEKPGYLQLKELDKKYKRGDKILVQIKNEEKDNKGAKLTSNISIAGKYVVLLSNSNAFKLSSKIEQENARPLEYVKDKLPANCGVIIRTEAQIATKEEIIEELDKLIKKYNEILEKAQNHELGLVYNSNKIEEKLVIDFINSSTKKVYLNDEALYNKLSQRLKMEDRSGMQVEYEDTNFLDKFGLKTEFSKINDRKIWLKSSGYLVIDKTEALTAIDVNSGKFEGNKDQTLETFAYKVNLEAAAEVMRQIRLKNIGGIIVVDFINMAEEAHKNGILKALNDEKSKDRAKVEIVEMTKLGLVEITRKKL